MRDEQVIAAKPLQASRFRHPVRGSAGDSLEQNTKHAHLDMRDRATTSNVQVLGKLVDHQLVVTVHHQAVQILLRGLLGIRFGSSRQLGVLLLPVLLQ